MSERHTDRECRIDKEGTKVCSSKESKCLIELPISVACCSCPNELLEVYGDSEDWNWLVTDVEMVTFQEAG